MFNDANINDLEMMFLNSLITYAGWPVRVEAIGYSEDRNVLHMHIRSLSTGRKRNVYIDDKFLDFTPVQLGMVNGMGTAVFSARRALRRYKQGLTKEAMNIFILDARHHTGAALRSEIREFNHKGLISCIKGSYPSLKESLEAVTTGEEASAFSRVFAVDSDMNLFYKASKVGMVNSDNGNLVFQPKKAYLKTLLEN